CILFFLLSASCLVTVILLHCGDEDIVCFKDIDPGAPHHYLVIPKKHIHSCLSLQADDINLVKKMADMGRDVLKAKNVTNLKDISLGFHVPPYITVPHLHLHVLAPFSQSFGWSRCKYTAIWYLTVSNLKTFQAFL
uniref:Si:dkey-25e12.3 n=1 Tax=Cyprinus carpio TaxID=7962 RepID=A0A8C1TG56_CYPCA